MIGLAGWIAEKGWLVLTDSLEDGWRIARIAMQDATTVQRLIALAVVVSPIVAFLVYHVRKW